VDRRGLERALDQAEVLRILDVAAVRDLLARSLGRHGSAAFVQPSPFTI